MASQTIQRHPPGNGVGKSEQIGEEQAEARVRLIWAVRMAIIQRGMTQVQAARLLGTDQPTLSKILRGRSASLSLDKLVAWLVILGRSVEIRVYPPAFQALPSFQAIVPGLNEA